MGEAESLFFKYKWKDSPFIKRIPCTEDKMCRCLEHQTGTSELLPKDPELTITLTTFGPSWGLPLSAVYS